MVGGGVRGRCPDPQSRKFSILLVLVLVLVLDLLRIREDEDEQENEDEFRGLNGNQSAFGNTPVRSLSLAF